MMPRVVVGKMTDRYGPRPVSVIGIAAAAAGTVPLALAGPHTSVALLGAALVVRGARLGAATIALMAGAFQGLARTDLPHASSVTRHDVLVVHRLHRPGRATRAGAARPS